MKIKFKTNAPKGRPFKKFYCDRNETFLLPPVAFKLWMYHYTREGEDRKSWPSVKTVMAACGLDRPQTFYQWRAYLKKNNWLEKRRAVPSKTHTSPPLTPFQIYY